MTARANLEASLPTVIGDRGSGHAGNGAIVEHYLYRGTDNRIGFALLLSGVRLTGRFPYGLELIPRSVLSHICAQL